MVIVEIPIFRIIFNSSPNAKKVNENDTSIMKQTSKKNNIIKRLPGNFLNAIRS